MVSNSHLKYAKALAKVAGEQNALKEVMHDLDGLLRLLKHKKFNEVFMQITFLDAKAKDELIDKTFKGKVQDVTLNLLKLLAKAKKLGLIPKICEIYRKLYHEATGMVDVMVRSARELDKDEEHALKEKLQQKIGKPLSLRFEQDPKLIGGTQIYEGGYLTDFSVQNYLQSLQQHLMMNHS